MLAGFYAVYFEQTVHVRFDITVSVNAHFDAYLRFVNARVVLPVEIHVLINATEFG